MMRAVQRTLAVFESFTAERSSLSLQELSARIGLPKSTAFRLVQSLEKAGYLVRLDDQHYCLSLRFTRLAGLVKSTLDIRTIARPVMKELAQATKETVSLQTASQGQRVCVDVVAAESALQNVTQPGEQVPLLAGASSKMLIAHMPTAQVAPIVAQIARLTNRSEADVQTELVGVRQRGYAISHGERVLGVSAVAAPIAGLEGTGTYCLSLGGPTIRVQGREEELVTQIARAAAEISQQYGGTVSVPRLAAG
jgi:DNA-binding IclR family transcriptional regulator